MWRCRAAVSRCRPCRQSPLATPAQKPRERNRRRVPEGWVESTEPFSRSFKVGKGATLLLANISGNIQVTAAAGEHIEVQALKRAWGPNAEQAKQRLATRPSRRMRPAIVSKCAWSMAERKDGRGVDVEFDVKVPADTVVELRTVSGDMRVTNVKGEVRVQGVSGNVVLEGTPQAGDGEDGLRRHRASRTPERTHSCRCRR